MTEPRYEVRIFWSPEDRLFLAEVPQLEGCITHGRTYEQALQHAREAMAAWLEVAREYGDPIPRPRGRRPAA
jgi:predicted RNase H-like HicB family nuclease